MNRRDRLLHAFHALSLTAKDISRLTLFDITEEKRTSGYIPIKSTFRLGDAPIAIDAEMQALLDDYLNTEDLDEQLKPFLDYRPNIGVHLFPSYRSGRGMSVRAIQRTLGS